MPRYKQSQIAKVLTECRGMTFVAAQRLGCSHHTINAWLEKSPALREIRELAKGALVDTAELKLAQAIQAGDLGAIKFFLQMQGRDRGYVARTELTGADGGPIISEVINGDDARVRLASRIDELAARRAAKATAERTLTG
jgi:hypothetical protein